MSNPGPQDRKTERQYKYAIYYVCVLLQNISTSLLKYLLAKYVLWALANIPLQRREQTEFIILLL